MTFHITKETIQQAYDFARDNGLIESGYPLRTPVYLTDHGKRQLLAQGVNALLLVIAQDILLGQRSIQPAPYLYNLLPDEEEDAT